MDRDEWLSRRTFDGASMDADRLAFLRREHNQRVSVCLPALNVEETVGPIVTAIRERWLGSDNLVDEIVVVDSQSTDNTRQRAQEAGAVVVESDLLLPEAGRRAGKGEALWKSLHACSGDIVVWIDSDLVDFDPAFVPGMLGPLLMDPDIDYVKAVYARKLGDSDDGGRVTEICARPLMNLFYPELAVLAQPLSGEAAGRRSLLERVPFFNGYAVEIGLLIDILRIAGMDAVAQVDIGQRRHSNQPTAALGKMAYAITQAVMQRAHEDGRLDGSIEAAPYARPVREDHGWSLALEPVTVRERPPIRTFPQYASTHRSTREHV